MHTLLAQMEKLGHSALALVPSVGLGLLVLAVFLIFGRGARGAVRRIVARLGRDASAAVLVGRLAQWSCTLLGLLVAATIAFPSFEVADLVEMLGVLSVGAGFAFRDILQNFLAGILILWTRPFRIGDEIVFGELEGEVTDVQPRATLLRTYDGRAVLIPNAELYTKTVEVNTRNAKRRVSYDVGIGVGDDIERARRCILDEVQQLPDALEDPAPDVRVVELADFSVKLRVRWWISPPRFRELVDARDEVLVRIKRRLLAEGIDLPFPTTQVLFHDQTESVDGDRRRQREGWPAGAHPPAPAAPHG